MDAEIRNNAFLEINPNTTANISTSQTEPAGERTTPTEVIENTGRMAALATAVVIVAESIMQGIATLTPLFREGGRAHLLLQQTALTPALLGIDITLNGLFFFSAVSDFATSIERIVAKKGDWHKITTPLLTSGASIFSIAASVFQATEDILKLTGITIPVATGIEGLIFAPAIFFSGVIDAREIARVWSKRTVDKEKAEQRAAWTILNNYRESAPEYSLQQKEITALKEMIERYEMRVQKLQGKIKPGNISPAQKIKINEKIRHILDKKNEIVKVVNVEKNEENSENIAGAKKIVKSSVKQIITDKEAKIIAKERKRGDGAEKALAAIAAWEELTATSKTTDSVVVNQEQKQAIEAHYDEKLKGLQNKWGKVSEKGEAKISKKMEKIEAKKQALGQTEQKSETIKALIKKKKGNFLSRPLKKGKEKWEKIEKNAKEYEQQPASTAAILQYRCALIDTKVVNHNRALIRRTTSLFVNVILIGTTITAAAVATWGTGLPVAVPLSIAIGGSSSSVMRIFLNILLKDKETPSLRGYLETTTAPERRQSPPEVERS